MAEKPQPRREQMDLPEAKIPAVYMKTIRISERGKINGLDPTTQAIKTLAQCVVDEDGNPVWTEDDWDIFAGNDTKRFFAYANRSFEMSGLLDGEEKKAETPS